MEVVYLKQSLRTAVSASPAIKGTLLLENVVSSYIPEELVVKSAV